jgi:hypothetical protein
VTRRAVLLLAGGAIGVAAAGGMAYGVSQWFGTQGEATTATGSKVSPEGLTIDKPLVDLGRVPLNVVVPVSVTLTNHTQQAVALGKPMAEALEGC